MNILSKTELKDLLTTKNENCISIYMPTHEAGPETRQDPIRLKNLIAKVDKELTDKGLNDNQKTELLQPIERLLESENNEFWQHQSKGLVIFRSDTEYRTYRLPIEFPELTIVGNNFYFKPLVPLLSENGEFLILALSQNWVRLLKASHHTVEEIELQSQEVPRGLADALRYDDPEKSLQYHSQNRGSSKSPIYHGQGVGTTDNKNEIWRFLQKLDAGLQPYLQEQGLPLILAGVGYLLPIYREANTYANFLDEIIEGNPEVTSKEELQRLGWEKVRSHFQEDKEKAIQEYHQLAGNGQASSRLEDIVIAAHNGQVDTLFVDRNWQKWGTIDPQDYSVAIDDKNPESRDLADFAAIQTFLQDGKVYPIENDRFEDTSIAAIFRYPVVAAKSKS